MLQIQSNETSHGVVPRFVFSVGLKLCFKHSDWASPATVYTVILCVSLEVRQAVCLSVCRIATSCSIAVKVSSCDPGYLPLGVILRLPRLSCVDVTLICRAAVRTAGQMYVKRSEHLEKMAV